MKKIVVAGVALSALVAAPAMAADLAVKAPVYRAPPPVVPVWSWTGCYVGAHVGGLWAQKEFIERTPDSEFVGLSHGTHDVDSWLGGLQAGCDYQFAGGFVVGIQGDYAWSNAEGEHASVLDPDISIRTRIKSLATVTGRFGFAWDRFLGYVKGGGAWERDHYDVFLLSVLDGSASESRSGWTVGIGGEYAFTNYLSGFVEYNYYDFGTRENTFAFFDGTGLVDIKETKSVVRAGLNLRFGGWGKYPVSARY